MFRKILVAAAGLLALSAFAPSFAATPTCVIGAKGTAPTATLAFAAPTTNADGTPVTGPLTYNLYQGTASGAEVKVASALAGTPIIVTTGLTDTTYYWYVTAVNAAGESAPSNEACKTFPASVPSSITITIN